MTAVQKFEKKHMAAFQELAEVTKLKKELEKREKEAKESLCAAMEKHGVAAIDNDLVKVTYIAASETVAVDLKQLRAEDPELYHEIEKKYNRRSKRKAYIKVAAK